MKGAPNPQELVLDIGWVFLSFIPSEMIFMKVNQLASVMPNPSWTGVIGRPIYAQGPPVF